jgi:formylmethanofuran dehydrogenase subunit E
MAENWECRGPTVTDNAWVVLGMNTLQELLEQSAELHRHLCPRQVLGVRMGIAAGQLLGLDLPQADKRLLTIVETDGCFTDGVAVATNCWVGRRTLRVLDYGKVAATFVDTQTGAARRIVPSAEARTHAANYAPEAHSRWEAMLLGYQRMPQGLLLRWQAVELTTPVAEILSRPGARALCDRCGEEILNEREIVRGGITLCRSCAGDGYYQPVSIACALAGDDVSFP